MVPGFPPSALHCAHQLVERQAISRPAAIAVTFEQQQISYGTLNQRANVLAHRLQQLGVGPEVLVGICVERSLEMVIGVLAIFKAGGAYLPLDPDYPAERLAFMVSDAQIAVLLTQRHLIERLSQPEVPVVYLDSDWLATAAPLDNPQSGVLPHHLAYCIYTSGSTGQPKGVLVEHGSLWRLALAHLRLFRVHPTSRIFAFASFNFDVALSDLMMAWAAGATLCLMPKAFSLPGPALTQLLRQLAITHIELPASSLNATPYADLPDLAVVIVGGEACSAELVRQWAPGRCFFNVYGPTENTISATLAECTVDEATPPIGQPLDYVQIYLLDEACQPVPYGATGEIYIGGGGLARGYHNRPDLNQARFIANPFGEGRLYKSGDLARYRSDGKLEFVGRIDNQVKVRGFRIELEEIESVLNAHPDVRQAAVMVHEEQGGTGAAVRRLVAYVAPKADNATPQAEHLTHWHALYAATYGQETLTIDPTFNITGWNSSYTGLPIPAGEMRAWLDHTVAEILALHPQRVLEMGCGTGLLLYRIAPHCTAYYAADFAQEALDAIQQVKLRNPALDHVQLFQRKADEFTGLPTAAFDVVILNSVVQYFPSIDYLLQVLEGAVRAVKPGGFIYLGDMRSLPLLAAFHASVQLHQVTDTLTRAQFRRRVQQRLALEGELVIAPDFFLALSSHWPAITGVQIRLKRGHDRNELTKFRYQVILQVGATAAHAAASGADSPPAAAQSLRWSAAKLSLAAITEKLTVEQPTVLHLQAVPNARLQSEAHLLAWLAEEEKFGTNAATVGDLRHQLAQASTPEITGLDPEALYALGARLGYTTAVTWSATGPVGAIDVLYHRSAPLALCPEVLAAATELKPWSTYANNPLLNRLERTLIPNLREFLGARLPDYMIPAHFVLLDRLPLSANGKLERSALPAPSFAMAGLESNYIPPTTPTEDCLAVIWADVLRLAQVGIQDNFFEVGGDSILAVQIVVRAHQAGLQLTTAQIFQQQTIAELATVVAQKMAITADALPGYRLTPPPTEHKNGTHNPLADLAETGLSQAELEQLLMKFTR